MNTCKYGPLWQSIFLYFGYVWEVVSRQAICNDTYSEWQNLEWHVDYKIRDDVDREIGRLSHNKRHETTFEHPFEFRYLGIGLLSLFYYLHKRTDSIKQPGWNFQKISLKRTVRSESYYREFSPYANFITANFITAVFQNYY